MRPLRGLLRIVLGLKARPIGLTEPETQGRPRETALDCRVCGAKVFQDSLHDLDSKLTTQWELSSEEIQFMSRRGECRCVSCGTNLRGHALAGSILAHLGAEGTLREASQSERFESLRILEVNEAEMLHSTLQGFKGHVFGTYPEVDLHALPYPDESFDLVVHSDTLEHIQNPVLGLSECRRVLRRGGALCFTVPEVVGRMSRSRAGLPKSFHGDPALESEDFVVHTEFGADVWTYAARAGFSEVSVHSVLYPCAFAYVAKRGD